MNWTLDRIESVEGESEKVLNSPVLCGSVFVFLRENTFHRKSIVKNKDIYHLFVGGAVKVKTILQSLSP